MPHFQVDSVIYFARAIKCCNFAGEKEKAMDALEPIKQKIYEIRGRRMMLDSDLAALYCVETLFT